MKNIIPVFLVFIFFVSCENKSGSNEQQAAPSVANPLFPAVTDTSTKSNSGAALALNPKHGEPGHRCDIAEGAPLPAPVQNSSIQPTINQAPVTPAIIPSNTDNKKETPVSNAGTAGMNPKHGEPGHRCDIAVGAPLNSKPNQ
jgi:hypothetical protein